MPNSIFGQDETLVRKDLDRRMDQGFSTSALSLRERFALTCRYLTDQGHARSLAGQVTVRAEDPDTFWTTTWGSGFGQARCSNLVRVNGEMEVVEGVGMPNPGVRFHLWIYRARPQIGSIVHTHPPFASALAMARQPLIVGHMDATPFYDDCAFLPAWPGLPIANEEGRIISEALGARRSILLANHGLLTTGSTLDAAFYRAVLLEQACEMQVRAAAVGPLEPLARDEAEKARDFLLKDSIVAATTNYWLEEARRRHVDALD
ncbi:aldolase [Caulobacter soli]|uniref:aldolase n=1 Tax=Caulobacter soli TaxID=2708539 RepID=UPI0013E9E43B|nr:aldolase [Caulobacter soli]